VALAAGVNGGIKHGHPQLTLEPVADAHQQLAAHARWSNRPWQATVAGSWQDVLERDRPGSEGASMTVCCWTEVLVGGLPCRECRRARSEKA